MSQPSSEPSRWQRLGESTQAKTRVFELLSARFRHPSRAIEKDFVVVRPPEPIASYLADGGFLP